MTTSFLRQEKTTPLFKSHLLAIFLFATSLSAETHRYLIGTRNAPREASRAIARDDSTTRGERELSELKVLAVDLTDDEAAALKRSGNFRYVEPAMERHLLDLDRPTLTRGTLASPYVSQIVPWGIDLVRAREVWPVTKGAGNVNVAIMDTGVDSHHPDLEGAIGGQYNTLTKSENATDDNNHGTHVAGTIAARDNKVGVVGVAPQAKIWAVKVLNNTGSGTTEDILAGIEWIITWKHVVGGNWIVSLSLGADQASVAEKEGFDRLYDEGILVIAATGNGAASALSYPAAYPTVLSVGAIDSSSRVATFSNGGAGIDVVAPGVGVPSTVPVDSVAVSSVRLDSMSSSVSSLPISGSASGDVTGTFMYCGYGRDASDFPPEVRGKIALIQRGAAVTFNIKIRNARAAGAIGAIVFNDDDQKPMRWNLIGLDCYNNQCVPSKDDLAFDWGVAVAISHVDGEKLLAGTARNISIGAWTDSYDTYSGTSMATPHVTGVAALLWSLSPKATAAQVTASIEGGARDVDVSGYDLRAGWGAVDAITSAKILAPTAFGLPAIPPPSAPPPLRRRTARP
jgi:subtilisin family serine protease